jgi:hypothetical protein
LQRLRLSFEPRGALGTGVDLRAQPSTIAIVLPIYRPRLDDGVLATVDRAIALLQHGDWHLVAPMSLEISFYEERYGKAIVRFPDACLDSRFTMTIWFRETPRPMPVDPSKAPA